MKKIVVILLLLSLLIAGASIGVQAAGSLFFVGVNNDIPVLLAGDTSPFYSDGKLYAPYTVFSANPGGINVSYNMEQEKFTLFTLSNTVVYDLAEGTVSDKSGKTYSVKVIHRNGILYIPIEQAAAQFGLTVSLINSESGCMLLRFKDGTEIYDDDKFLEKSEMFISHMLDTYAEDTTGDEIISEDENEQVEAEPVIEDTSVYLVFTGDAVSQVTLGHLEALEYVYGVDIHVTFYVTENQVRENRQLIRDIHNAGHKIGLKVDETGDVSDQLIRGNKALDEVVHFKTIMALLPENSPEVISYRSLLISQTVDSVDTVLMHPDQTFVLICNEDVAYALNQLSQNNYSVLQYVETSEPSPIVFNDMAS